MQVNWRRGFFRAWLVLAVAWLGLVGWYEYANKPWNQSWGPASVRTEGECWITIAKWPDGQPFDWSDLFEEADTPEGRLASRFHSGKKSLGLCNHSKACRL